MKTIVDWLHRLAAVTPEDGPELRLFKLIVPGSDPLDVKDWLLSVDPEGQLPPDIRTSGPESLSLIRLPDLPGRESNIHEVHRLGSEIACLFSLALNVRVIVPNAINIKMPTIEKQLFYPFSQIVDRSILGPLPKEPKYNLKEYLCRIAGLSNDDLEIIGAASSSYHAALLLFDREPRAAYTLLVAGIEVLSRKYGKPPTSWDDWEESNSWNTFISDQLLTPIQADAFRERLMKDKQLRLGAIFRNYAAFRLSDNFWQKPWKEWTYGINANNGKWLSPVSTSECLVGNILPNDRFALQKALGKSYGLRSSIVHESDWVELLSIAQVPAPAIDLNKPLPFAILRAILAELIWLEISTRSEPCQLPDFTLLRGNSNVSAQ